MLRLTERTDRIAHVPKVLYHSRRRPTTVDSVLARHAANRDESRALVEALHRRGTPGRTRAVFARKGPRCYVTRLNLTERPLVSIIIPTKDKRSLLQTTLESIWARTDYDRYEIIVIDNESTDADAVSYLASLAPRCQVHRWSQRFNYSAINNFGVQHARGEQLLFLNNDVEVIQPDWLTAMLEHAQRPDVGGVGARLLYGDGRIQHAGVVVGINRVAANAFRSWPGETTGNLRLADLTRNCSAVTGACMMVPRRIFDEVGGFDENLRVVLNDVDLCLEIRQRGYLVVYTPEALLYHYEGSSRGRLHPPPDEKVFDARWSDFVDRGIRTTTRTSLTGTTIGESPSIRTNSQNSNSQLPTYLFSASLKPRRTTCGRAGGGGDGEGVAIRGDASPAWRLSARRSRRLRGLRELRGECANQRPPNSQEGLGVWSFGGWKLEVGS